MSELFAKYPEIPGVASETNTTAEKSVWERKFKKQLKKQNRLLTQLIKLIERRTPAEQPASEEANTKKNSFLYKVGDAFVKALPAILSAVATALIGYFSSKPRSAICNSGIR